MKKCIKTAKALAIIGILIYGIICVERWQRPEGLKKIIESVDTNMASV